MKAVISFHAVDAQPGPLSFSPKHFDELVDALRRCGVPILSLDRLLAPETGEGVALTFDDGIESLHRNALPILKKHAAPAHLFLTTAFVAGDNRWPGQPDYARRYGMLDWSQIEDLHANNVAIDAHTATHPDLRKIDDAHILEEFDVCDSEIERRIGRRPRYFAYPYGFFNSRVAATAGRQYEACFTTRLQYVPEKLDHSMVPRLDSHYLRSKVLMRNLGHPAARAYIAGRSLVRLALGRT